MAKGVNLPGNNRSGMRAKVFFNELQAYKSDMIIDVIRYFILFLGMMSVLGPSPSSGSKPTGKCERLISLALTLEVIVSPSYSPNP